MNNSIAILIYSNSEYSFLWDMLVKLINKYVDSNIQIFFLTNENTELELKKTIPTNWIYCTYSESLIWTKRIYNCLKNINYEYILFIHDDWIPIGNVTEEILISMINFMRQQECNFLLSYSHFSTVNNQKGIYSGYNNYFYYKEDNHIFQPAIWNKIIFEDFCNILNKSKHQNEDSDCLDFMRNKNCYSIQNKETVLSLRTTNSLFFPHMHVLSQGLWNFTKYPSLKSFLESYGIDTSTRGIHPWWELDTQ